MEMAKIIEKEDLKPIALEVLDLLRPRQLAVWQVKEVLAQASRLAEWTPME